MKTSSLDGIYLPLWLCYGLVPIVAGADKFTNLLTDWAKYLPSAFERISPLSPHAFMQVVGVIEIAAGLAVLTVLPRLGAYVVALWLVSIAIVMTIGGFYDVAVRDLVMALGAVTLGNVAALRGQPLVPGLSKPLNVRTAAVAG